MDIPQTEAYPSLRALLVMTTKPNIMGQRGDEHRISRRSVRPIDDDIACDRVLFVDNES
jgi:hypothetical protein